MGTWIQKLESLPPASSSSTRYLPDADSLLASTQPAEPAPVTIKSKVSPLSGIFTSLHGFRSIGLDAPGHHRSRRILQHHGRAFFADHDGGRVGIATDNDRHD